MLRVLEVEGVAVLEDGTVRGGGDVAAPVAKQLVHEEGQLGGGGGRGVELFRADVLEDFVHLWREDEGKLIYKK